MTEAEYLNLVAEKAGAPTVTVRNVLMSMKNLHIELLPNGDTIPIPGLGRMNMVSRAARMGHNPSTGAAVSIPSKNAVKIRPAKALQDAV